MVCWQGAVSGPVFGLEWRMVVEVLAGLVSSDAMLSGTHVTAVVVEYRQYRQYG